MESHNFENEYIAVSSVFLQGEAEDEIGRILTSEELVQVQELIIGAAEAVIRDSINKVVKK